jgi:hypothetical protein
LARLVHGDRELAPWWPAALPIPSLDGDSVQRDAMVQNAVSINSPSMFVGLRTISEGTTARRKRFNVGTATISVVYDTDAG